LKSTQKAEETTQQPNKREKVESITSNITCKQEKEPLLMWQRKKGKTSVRESGQRDKVQGIQSKEFKETRTLNNLLTCAVIIIA
jgi:hypothetical protein